MTAGTIDPAFWPSTPDELEACLGDPLWRISSGFLYNILIKEPQGDGSDKVTVIPFRPNRAQKRLLRRLWRRNIICKARQLGFTTLVCIVWLDHALFNPNQRCGIISYDKTSAQTILNDKIIFAYKNLPPEIQAARPIRRHNAEELVIIHEGPNGEEMDSSIRCATTMRSGTIHRLLVSEYGKICAKTPLKALEVQTGSLQAVPLDGCVVIESTAEGREGDFYRKCKEAMRVLEMNRPLALPEYRFHFEPWWDTPEYEVDPTNVVISAVDHQYFERVEVVVSAARARRRLPPLKLSLRKRAWYVLKRRTDFGDEDAKMWQEYPSFPDEAFQQSTEGVYYWKELSRARISGRVGYVPFLPGVPVNSFWDIGATDGTAFWLHQSAGLQNRFLYYYEGYGEGYSHFISEMQRWAMECAGEVVWGRHFLPHDAMQKRQLGTNVMTPLEMITAITPGWEWTIVPQVAEIQHGIQAVRQVFPSCWFDEAGTRVGVDHLSLYRKEFNETTQAWSDRPRHDEHSEAADSFRQFAQARIEPGVFRQTSPTKRRVSARAA